MTNEKRSSFTGKLGFVLAAAGSAVGLGNLWRFPYLAAKYGGGIFLLVYLILALTFGFALMTAEIAIGRKTGKSAIAAFEMLSKKWAFVGYLGAIVPIIILPYYSVIGGWVAKYFSVYLTGGAAKAVEDNFFNGFVSSEIEPIIWFFIYLFITGLVVIFGVEKGIERVSKIMMPILVILAVAVAIFSCTLDGAVKGLSYYFVPDFSMFSLSTVLGAMGQMFYSMSIAMGIMITYGSYMKKDVSIGSSVAQIEIFDTAIAFVAGLIVIPGIVATTGAIPEEPGPGLMFVSLPKVFQAMGPVLGAIVGSAFFLLVLFAALTSSISLYETVVSILCDKLKLKRTPACIIVFVFSFLLGLVSCLGFSVWKNIKPLGLDDLLTFFDFLTNSVIMPIVALLTCVVVGYVVGTKSVEDEVELYGQKFGRKRLFRVMIKYIAPICLVLILLTSVITAFESTFSTLFTNAFGADVSAAILRYFVV